MPICIVTAEMSSCPIDSMTYKAENNYYMALYKTTLLIAKWEYCSNSGEKEMVAQARVIALKVEVFGFWIYLK